MIGSRHKKEMKIGLIDVDGHNFPNLALMKLSSWHKAQGDAVEWYTIFDHYDLVYMAKVFTHTPDWTQVIANADEVIKGGTGYDVDSRLPEGAEKVAPDYSLYPYIDKKTAYGFLTRGCIRKCPWCIVPRKEGNIHPYQDVEEIAVDGRTNLILMDNNILAAGDYGMGQLRKISEKGYRIDFNQAMDARLVTDEVAEVLASVKWINRRIRFGCDTPKQVEDCENAVSLLQRHGFKGEFFFYTMLNSDFDESFARVLHWWERNREARSSNKSYGFTPYAQPYLDFTTTRQDIPMWQLDIARWCNKHQLFNCTRFEDYEPRKGFKCGKYFENVSDT